MILHLFAHPFTPLAVQVLQVQSAQAPDSPVAVLLPAAGDAPHLPGLRVYRLADQAAADSGGTISYARLVELLFQAEKVVTW